MKTTKATAQLRKLVELYSRFLPKSTFTYIPLVIAAFFQVFAWTSGSTFLKDYTLFPRILILWCFALGEYLFMSPTMNAAVEILGKSEAFLVVIYSIITQVVFVGVNTMIYKNPFEFKYVIAFTLIAIAVYIIHMW